MEERTTDAPFCAKICIGSCEVLSTWIAPCPKCNQHFRLGVLRRAEFYYQQLDALRSLRHEVRRDLVAEGKKHKATKLLGQIPSIGPIRAALLIALIQTPHGFRTKRPLWKYSGLAIETHSSADYRSIKGQLQRTKKQVSVRGLNRDCNHDLKNLFKSAATIAAFKTGPFQEFYAAMVAKGMKPEKPKPLGYNAKQPRLWGGRPEQILLDRVGCESRNTFRPLEMCFFLDSLYRTYQASRNYFRIARDSAGIANTPSAYSHVKAEPKMRHWVILRLVK